MAAPSKKLVTTIAALGGGVSTLGLTFKLIYPTAPESIGAALAATGAVLFFSIMVVTLRALNAQDIAKEIASELRLDRYALLAARMNATLANARQMHAVACREVVDRFLDRHLPGVVAQFGNLSTGQIAHVEDHSVINHFLEVVARQLPSQSVWLGITHLDDVEVWVTHGHRFSEFAKAIQGRAQGKTLSVMRIYCFERESDIGDGMKAHLNAEHSSGIHIRVAVGPRMKWPTDMSLLWEPTPQLPRNYTLDDPALLTSQKELQPHCGMKFTALPNSVLTELIIHPGDSQGFKSLMSEFETAWKPARAWPFEDASTPAATT